MTAKTAREIARKLTNQFGITDQITDFGGSTTTGRVRFVQDDIERALIEYGNQKIEACGEVAASWPTAVGLRSAILALKEPTEEKV